MDQEEPTQLTQGVVDPRRLGRNNSGLSQTDVADVICILHPCSPAAFKLVAATAERSSRHVLQKNRLDWDRNDHSQSFLEEQETFILGVEGSNHAMDLAFRFSCLPMNPAAGFVFGRHETLCDVVLPNDTHKRVSNVHFSIFINDSGVLMLHDMSTNGTMVDDVLLKGKIAKVPQTRMLNPGSIIQILSPQVEEIVKFIVRVPSRDGRLDEYEARFQEYMRKVNQCRAKIASPANITRHLTPTVPLKPPHTRSVRSAVLHKQFGMHWSGGERYNVVGLIGKGAFATVYQLATKAEGMLFAAKELEKRKFMKNGVLDQKLDNEMQIMKGISHPNIVKYVDYHDHTNHLYIIMEFVACGDLQHYLSRYGPLSEHLSKKMSAQVLDSLAYLHAKRITHRDIKPDNILLADISENFTIKLSDFGLSKVVKDNETFLKTFCGTLLYCAPEVFPHYDAHMTGRGHKRARKAAAPGPKFHSYSQSVDIWSFGAVLWYSLCLKPPFEGVADTTGRGMFDKIMMTPLDSTDLVERRVSDDAVSLLAEMLNTDPALRPSPAECLRHPWLGTEAIARVYDPGLRAIAEEDDEGIPEQNLASLRLHEGDEQRGYGLGLSKAQQDEEQGGYEYEDEASVHSDSFNFFDPRQSKRFKSSAYAYRNQEGDAVDSSPDLLQTAGNDAAKTTTANETAEQRPSDGARPRLFGEISESQFAMLNLQHNEAGTKSTAPRESDGIHIVDPKQQNAQKSSSHVASPSLLGAESLLRDVHMHSSKDSFGSSGLDPKSFDAPQTPANLSHHDSYHISKDGIDDATPRQPQVPVFNRRISIPMRASFFYDPSDPDTHTVEYASRVSGHDFRANPNMTVLGEHVSLPATNGSITEDDLESYRDHSASNTDHEEAVVPPHISTHFVKPPPRLGRLVSTDDSFCSVTMNLTGRITYWGRNPYNTHVYPDPNDTRIPKRGIIIYFISNTHPKISDSTDMTKISDLQAVVLTESRTGLKVNGVSLQQSEGGERFYGMLHTGDEVVVHQPSHRNGQKALKFRCEFYHGESKEERPTGDPGFQVLHTKGSDFIPPQPPSRSTDAPIQ